MQKLVFLLVLAFFCNKADAWHQQPRQNDTIADLYAACGLSGKLDYEIFEMAMRGYGKMEKTKPGIITIIDFSVPSTHERMFIINLKQKRLVLQTLVAHGSNTGEDMALHFSKSKMIRA